ncbi:MAG: lytic transglycosylase domain-containing protein [Actinomycetota bacterium]
MFSPVVVAVALLIAGGVRLAADPADATAPSPAVSQPSGTTAQAPALSAREDAAPQASRGLGDDGMPAAASAPERPVSHRIEAGETLSSIAARYAVDVDRLARRNAIDDARALAVGSRLVLPDPDATRPVSVADAMEAELPLERMLEEVATEFGWRPETVKAVAWVESRWSQRLVSTEGAIGVMQVLPATARRMSAQGDRDLDPYDVRDNVTAGVAYLDHLHERFDGDVEATLAAYVQGPTSLRRDGAYPISERYVEDVLDARERFGR